jgi:hypothetical protein
MVRPEQSRNGSSLLTIAALQCRHALLFSDHWGPQEMIRLLHLLHNRPITTATKSPTGESNAENRSIPLSQLDGPWPMAHGPQPNPTKISLPSLATLQGRASFALTLLGSSAAPQICIHLIDSLSASIKIPFETLNSLTTGVSQVLF